jgi:hypothetical protein
MSLISRSAASEKIICCTLFYFQQVVLVAVESKRKMLLRIRSNITTVKLEVDENWTIEEFVKLIIEKCCITEATTLTLARDGNQIISKNKNISLKTLGLTHAELIYILDRFEQLTIEKDYINDNHELVKAGKKLKIIEVYKNPTENDENENIEEVSTVNRKLAVTADVPNNIVSQPIQSRPQQQSEQQQQQRQKQPAIQNQNQNVDRRNNYKESNPPPHIEIPASSSTSSSSLRKPSPPQEIPKSVPISKTVPATSVELTAEVKYYYYYYYCSFNIYF